MRSTADVVVIGAGIVGAAVAHRIATQGLRVTVLERGLPGRQGSGATAGNVHIQTIHTRRPGQQVPVDVRRLLPLQRASRLLWETWEDHIGAVGFRRTGGFMVAQTPEQVADLYLKHGWESGSDIPTEVLDGDAARAALPLLGPSVLAATWCEWDGFADPALVTPALVRAAVNAGASVCLGTRVRGLRRAGTCWTLEAGGDHWEAPVVVNAAGPWMGELSAIAGAEIAMTPTAIQMHTLKPRGLSLPFVIAHVGQGMSVKQTDDGAIMLGGGWPAGPFDGTRPAEVDPSSTAGNLAQARRVLPALDGCPLDRVWTGPLAVSPDEMPVVGEVPGSPGMFAVGGTYSFTFAPLWGVLVADLVAGRTPAVEIDDLGPARLLTDRKPMATEAAAGALRSPPAGRPDPAAPTGTGRSARCR
jgi:sarcosine oxidase subunit beta